MSDISGLMTREQMRQHLVAHGYPISKTYLDKLCSPLVNAGPIPERYFSRRAYYDPEKALGWAEAKSLAETQARMKQRAA